MNNLEFINGFKNISVRNICKNKKIDYSNLTRGRSTKQNEEVIKEEIEKEYAKLYLKGEN